MKYRRQFKFIEYLIASNYGILCSHIFFVLLVMNKSVFSTATSLASSHENKVELQAHSFLNDSSLICFENLVQYLVFQNIFNICMNHKVNNRNTRKMCEMCSNLTIKIPERLEIDIVVVFSLLTLNKLL